MTEYAFLYPSRLTFKYQLKGFDEGWSSASPRRIAEYTNLPPGNYRFEVVSSSSQPVVSSVSFRIQAHFYQTWWFYAACCFLAGELVWLALRFYLKQTKLRWSLVFEERNRLAREMHDTVIQGCVAISTLLEAALSRGEDLDDVLELLERARTQTTRTLNEAREAVAGLRNSPHGTTLESLREFTEELSKQTGITCDVQAVGDVEPIDSLVNQNLLFVAKEAIRNAAAHGKPKHIYVRFSVDSAEVRLDVADDGCGFVPEVNHLLAKQHYGIMGMRERVEQVGGVFLLESKVDRGTLVQVRMPLSVKDLRRVRSAHV